MQSAINEYPCRLEVEEGKMFRAHLEEIPQTRAHCGSCGIGFLPNRFCARSLVDCRPICSEVGTAEHQFKNMHNETPAHLSSCGHLFVVVERDYARIRRPEPCGTCPLIMFPISELINIIWSIVTPLLTEKFC